MLQEVLDVISPQDTGCYVDGTFGGGGYTRALLDSSQCRVFAFDRDPSAHRVSGNGAFKRFPACHPGRSREAAGDSRPR